ncbi:MAG: hypothetical protein PHR35_13120 [Kiritimatiellae bacterium]|nr:hypothetical protein [Kiritimatiellia bacterium]
MNRREFLTTGVTGAAAVSLCGCATLSAKEDRGIKNGAPLTRAALDKLTHEWWKTSATDKGGGRFEWDEEIKAVNALTPPAESIPQWAIDVRGAMPRYGFEICSHRWLDGLDDVIHMIGKEQHWPSTAGHCGDRPGRVIDAALQRAEAVECWLEGRGVDGRPLYRNVAKWLGAPDVQKKQAAECFVEMVRSFFTEPRPRKTSMPLAKTWRSKANENTILKEMFAGEGFDNLLDNQCGFKIVDRLDLYLQMIGGDMSRAGDRHGVCNDQRRFIYPDDPPRYETTRGFLWGLFAYLKSYGGEWLLSHRPECAGGAIDALNGVSEGGKQTPLRKWLVASFLKSTKLWIPHGIPKDRIPAEVRELPDVIEALKT